MKRSAVPLFCFSLFLLALGFHPSAAPAQEPNLRLLLVADEGLWYINTDTVARSSSNVVSFWKKVIPAKRGRNYREIQSLLEKAEKDFTRFDFFQTLNQVDCAKNQVRTLSELFYDRDKNILLSLITSNARWSDISHWDEGELVLDAVCPNPAMSKDKALSALPAGLRDMESDHFN